MDSLTKTECNGVRCLHLVRYDGLMLLGSTNRMVYNTASNKDYPLRKKDNANIKSLEGELKESECTGLRELSKIKSDESTVFHVACKRIELNYATEV